MNGKLHTTFPDSDSHYSRRIHGMDGSHPPHLKGGSDELSDDRAGEMVRALADDLGLTTGPAYSHLQDRLRLTTEQHARIFNSIWFAKECIEGREDPFSFPYGKREASVCELIALGCNRSVVNFVRIGLELDKDDISDLKIGGTV